MNERANLRRDIAMDNHRRMVWRRRARSKFAEALMDRSEPCVDCLQRPRCAAERTACWQFAAYVGARVWRPMIEGRRQSGTEMVRENQRKPTREQYELVFRAIDDDEDEVWA